MSGRATQPAERMADPCFTVFHLFFQVVKHSENDCVSEFGINGAIPTVYICVFLVFLCFIRYIDIW